MKKHLIYFSLTFISVFLISDCSYQKRLYRKGYYTDWLSKHNGTNRLKNQSHNIFIQLPEKISSEKTQFNKYNSLIASNKEYKNENIRIHTKHTKSVINNNDTCGDVIILRDGSEYLVKVIELTDKEIKYKRCDFLNGPVYSVLKSKVYSIKYINGYVEYFEENFDGKNISKNNQPKTHPPHYQNTITLGIIGIVFTFILLIGIFIIPFVMFSARKSIDEIKRNPDKYEGEQEMGCWMKFSIIFTFIMGIGSLMIYLVNFGLASVGAVSPYDGIIFLLFSMIFIVSLIIFYTNNKKFKH